jgi:signal transduction histidine kinase
MVRAMNNRSPLAHLLHALNQPLTGLQCSLELALMGSRTTEQYIGALRDGLDLTARMRVLVEAIRELVGPEPCEPEPPEVISLRDLLQETVRELQSVADERNVRILLRGNSPLAVQCGRPGLTAAAFRLLESALSLAAQDSVLDIRQKAEGEVACVSARWEATQDAPEPSPFSPQDLGLLLAQAAWEKAGAAWISERTGGAQTVEIRLPLVSRTRPSDVDPEVVR